MRLFFSILLLCFVRNASFTGRVRVKYYDHRAEHDPVTLWASGPWRYKGYGFGLEYQYNQDGSYQREKGYGYLKMFGREFCEKLGKCRPEDKNFFDHLKNFGNTEPYWAHPPSAVLHTDKKHLNQPTF